MHSLQENIHLTDYIRIVRRHRNTALIFFVVVVAAVTIASFVIPAVYRATVTLFIDLESPNMLTATDSVALDSQNYYAYKEYYLSQKEIIKSRWIARAVFDEFKLIEKPEYAKAKEPLEEFMKTISVESVRDTRLVKLHVEDKDPGLAAEIANKIAELYTRQNLEYITRGEYLNLLKNEYLKLQSKFSEYTKIYKEKHPQMIRLKERMAQMAERIEAEKGKAMTGIGGEDAVSSSRGHSLDFADSIDTSAAAPEENNNSGLSSLNVELDSLKANNIRIMDPAEKPVVPVWPRKRLNVIMALVVGLFGGVGLAFFAEYLDITVKGEWDIEQYIKMPFLGNVPRIESERGSKKFAGAEKEIVCSLAPNSIAAEAYRAIRTSVLFALQGKEAVKDIMITSPGPREGKTLTACNLAITFADLGNRVLLIDADMRKPRLHGIFGLDNIKGLGSILKSAGGVDIMLDGYIHKTKIENLFVIPADPPDSNFSELVGSPRMKELVNSAKDRFDIVLFDTPPINVITDAAIVAGFIGGVIVVVEGGKTAKKILSRTERLLKNAKAQVLGIVVNNITRADKENLYYSNYYYNRGEAKK